MIRVLHFINSFAAGGAELLVCQLAPLLCEYGFAPVVVALSDVADEPGQQARMALEAKGIPNEIIGKSVGKEKLKSFFACMHIVERWQPAIVHTHCDSPDFYGGMATVLKPAKHISTLHSVVRPSSITHRFAWLCRDILARTHYVAISEAVNTSWRKSKRIRKSRIIVVPNGVNPHRFDFVVNHHRVRQGVLQAPEDSVVILAVGRLQREKGFSSLIHAFANLATRYSNIHLTILGEGPMRAELKNLGERLGVSHRLSMPGTTDRVPEAMKAADILVVPSLWEGFGLVTIEGLMAELPVIASDVDGLGEIVRHGAPILTFSANDISEMSQRIEYLLTSPEIMTRLVKDSKTWATKHYSLDTMVNGYVNAYLELLGLNNQH